MSSKLTLLIALVLLIVQINGASKVKKSWWKNTFVYQIHPSSFMDSDGDGIGDLNGITSKLEHLVDMNVSALSISSIYASSTTDIGQDVTNFTDIDPTFGDLGDFGNLTAKAKSLGLKVLLDLVPNHSSTEHQWFKDSVKRIKPYDDYYIWQDAKLLNGSEKPPNNWLSVNGGSAWEWNAERAQYYYHQFGIDQPDLNYRNVDLNTEMQEVLTFWLDQGVDGFCIHAINRLFEDPGLLDEPELADGVQQPEDYHSLKHIYTKDLNDTYVLLKSWRKLIDAHGKKLKGDSKLIVTEADTNLASTMMYYEAGSNVPFNMMFVTDLNNESRAADFKLHIDRWMNSMPKGDVANWVVGNDNNRRVASRFGDKRVDQFSMLAAVLPGVGVIYNGDEIGMEDMWLSYNETHDPTGCQAGPQGYQLYSRDPERTPFQWDDTTSAGFSINNDTWLPVNPNYKTVNLAAQKAATVSHYLVFKKLVALKKQPIMETSSMEVILVTENVLGVVRRDLDVGVVVLLINFTERMVVIDARTWMNIPEQLFVYVSSVESKIPAGVNMDTTVLNMPGAASVILTSQEDIFV